MNIQKEKKKHQYIPQEGVWFLQLQTFDQIYNTRHKIFPVYQVPDATSKQ